MSYDRRDDRRDSRDYYDRSREYDRDRYYGAPAPGYYDRRGPPSGGGYNDRRGPPPSFGGRRLFVSGTGRATVDDIERIFDKYGRIVDIAIKNGFCFVEYQDERDAADAVHGRDGYEFNGARIRVEHCKPRKEERPPRAERPPKCYNCGQDGHIVRDCKNGDWSNRCYICKEEGHKSMACPQKQGGRAPANNGSAPASSAPSSSSAPSDRNRSRSRSRSPRRSRSRERSRSRSRDRESNHQSSAPADSAAAPAPQE